MKYGVAERTSAPLRIRHSTIQGVERFHGVIGRMSGGNTTLYENRSSTTEVYPRLKATSKTVWPSELRAMGLQPDSTSIRVSSKCRGSKGTLLRGEAQYPHVHPRRHFVNSLAE